MHMYASSCDPGQSVLEAAGKVSRAADQEVAAEVGEGGEGSCRATHSEREHFPHHQPADWSKAQLHMQHSQSHQLSPDHKSEDVGAKASAAHPAAVDCSMQIARSSAGMQILHARCSLSFLSTSSLTAPGLICS